jgi:sulfate/thiosulfate transport system permease protein
MAIHVHSDIKAQFRKGKSKAVQYALIAIALVFLLFFLLLPLAAIFAAAIDKGLSIYLQSFANAEVLSAIKLTLITAAVSVSGNTVFGIAAAWAIARFDFTGKSILITLIDIPFAVSPVISGMVFVLIFGLQGFWGPWLANHNIRILFAVPGIILATTFVTFPFVARELITLMQSQGRDEEEAAMVLGAGGWRTFFHITLPNIKWGLLYGIILCNARAMGEFGAVSVVSGHIRGLTNTMPLEVEILYNEYNFVAAFAVASLLALLAIITLVAKSLVEWKMRRPEQAVLKLGALRS